MKTDILFTVDSYCIRVEKLLMLSVLSQDAVPTTGGL